MCDKLFYVNVMEGIIHGFVIFANILFNRHQIARESANSFCISVEWTFDNVLQCF